MWYRVLIDSLEHPARELQYRSPQNGSIIFSPRGYPKSSQGTCWGGICFSEKSTRPLFPAGRGSKPLIAKPYLVSHVHVCVGAGGVSRVHSRLSRIRRRINQHERDTSSLVFRYQGTFHRSILWTRVPYTSSDSIGPYASVITRVCISILSLFWSWTLSPR